MKTKELYDKYGSIIRFLFILIIALWINYYVLPDLKTPSDNVQKITEANTTYLSFEEGYFNLNQNDINSGNINALLWKIIYLGGGKDKICFEKTNFSSNETLSASYNGGDFFNVTKKKCINIPKNQDRITFQLSYSFTFNFPEMPAVSKSPVNKSDCVWFTGNNTCITQYGIDHAVTQVFYPNGEVYLEANWFHKFIKFIFIFFSAGAVLWGFSRTFYLIKYGWDKKQSINSLS